MNQLELFDRDRKLRRRIRELLVRLEFREAERLCAKYAELPGAEPLGWELDVLKFEKRQTRRRLGLDDGLRLWEEFRSRLFFNDIPHSYAEQLENSYFSRLLAANRSLFDSVTTPDGTSLGVLYLRAGQPRNARKWIEKEIKECGENWRRRVHLGNCHLRLKDKPSARTNYIWAFLRGLPATAHDEIEDRELVSWLRSASSPEWAFVEEGVSGRVAFPRFKSLGDYRGFLAAFVEPIESDPDSMAPSCRFGIWLMLSENRRFCDDDLLRTARLRMRELNPRLHAEHMTGLETRGG